MCAEAYRPPLPHHLRASQITGPRGCPIDLCLGILGLRVRSDGESWEFLVGGRLVSDEKGKHLKIN